MLVYEVSVCLTCNSYIGVSYNGDASPSPWREVPSSLLVKRWRFGAQDKIALASMS
jgi:hypothetical protein